MVAMGLMTQLALEGLAEEANRLAEFLCAVGLPAHLGQVRLAADQIDNLRAVATGAARMWLLAYEPVPTDQDAMVAAMIEADRIGKAVARRVGDAAYRALRGQRSPSAVRG
jgi:glycerol dehydrogenase-like iron-containing ADH family enzyme